MSKQSNEQNITGTHLEDILKEKENNQSNSQVSESLKLIQILKNAGIFFIVIDGKLCLNGKVLDISNITNIGQIYDIIEQLNKDNFFKKNLKIEKIYIQESIDIDSNTKQKYSKYFELYKPLENINNQEVEIDFIEKNREYFRGEQIHYTNEDDEIKKQKKLFELSFLNMNNVDEEKAIVNSIDIKNVTNFHKKLTNKDKQIVFKIDGKIVTIHKVRELFNGYSISEIQKCIKFSD